jgi:aspartate carbamoyltransferase catalytic subunit
MNSEHTICVCCCVWKGRLSNRKEEADMKDEQRKMEHRKEKKRRIQLVFLDCTRVQMERLEGQKAKQRAFETVRSGVEETNCLPVDCSFMHGACSRDTIRKVSRHSRR